MSNPEEGDSSSGSQGKRLLDTGAFAVFEPFLEACQDYAEHSGCRFQQGAFVDLETEQSVGSSLVAAKLRAAPAVEEYSRRLRDGEEGLLQCAGDAYRLVMAESVRNGIVATCRDVGLWPPDPAPSGVGEDDYAWKDTAAPLPTIAQRTYNDQRRREREDGPEATARRAATASFLMDFVTVVGVPPPALSDDYPELLQEFMARVEEWTVLRGDLCYQSPAAPDVALPKATGGVKSRTRDALLVGLGLGLVAEAVRRVANDQWPGPWEAMGLHAQETSRATVMGAVLGAAAVCLAAATSLAALRRVGHKP